MFDKRKIILNNVFPNATYNTGNNLYHETINMFQTDDGKFFLHLNANGTYDKKEPVDVLNVARAGKGLYQVLSIAENCRLFEGADIIGKDKGKERYNAQTQKIKYGKCYVEEYFADNKTFYGVREKDLFVTFECDGIFEPNQTIYIAFNNFDDHCIQRDAEHAVISEKISKEKFSSTCRINTLTDEDQEKIRKILPDTNHRCMVGTFYERCKELRKKTGSTYEENYFSLLGVDKQELQYSNAIAKILQFNDWVMSKFLTKLGVKISKKNTFEILREEKNIDLLFRDLIKRYGNIVIIENKIDAGLTLSNSNEIILKQAQYIFEDVFELKKGEAEEHDKWNALKSQVGAGGQSPSQLSKYYLYALCWALKAGWSEEQIEKNIYCFFLCPDYHKELYSVDTSTQKLTIPYAFANKYKLIAYSEFKKYMQDIFYDVCKIKDDLTIHQKFIVEDFMDAISSMSKQRDDSIEIAMIRKFIERQKELSK